ncbi:MAG: hypothetical protein JG770_1317 [Mahella sp.]|nr:hypothetical protein [Mahella sp.]
MQQIHRPDKLYLQDLPIHPIFSALSHLDNRKQRLAYHPRGLDCTILSSIRYDPSSNHKSLTQYNYKFQRYCNMLYRQNHNYRRYLFVIPLIITQWNHLQIQFRVLSKPPKALKIHLKNPTVCILIGNPIF